MSQIDWPSWTRINKSELSQKNDSPEMRSGRFLSMTKSFREVKLYEQRNSFWRKSNWHWSLHFWTTSEKVVVWKENVYSSSPVSLRERIHYNITLQIHRIKFIHMWIYLSLHGSLSKIVWALCHFHIYALSCVTVN